MNFGSIGVTPRTTTNINKPALGMAAEPMEAKTAVTAINNCVEKLKSSPSI